MENTALTLTAAYQAKRGYIHRKIAGSDVLVSVGENIHNFNGYIELNESAAFLWDALKEPTTGHALAEQLADAFCIHADQAADDVLEFLVQLTDHKMVVMT